MDVNANFDGEVSIGGYPDRIDGVEVPGERARQLADLALHRWDLEMANGCLDILETPPELDKKRLVIVSAALWREAVCLLVKCFGKDARVRLVREAIFSDQEELIALQSFIDERNKLFQHDANSYTQQRVLALINAGDRANKVEDVIAINAFATEGDQNRQRLLRRLVDQVEQWVTAKYDRLRDEVKVELESMSYDDLKALPPLKMRARTAADVRERR